jgi:hypothetical protein
MKADRNDVILLNRWHKEAIAHLKAGRTEQGVSDLLHCARYASANLVPDSPVAKKIWKQTKALIDLLDPLTE